LINSDQDIYGGSGVGNGSVINTLPEPCHGKDNALSLTLPPLATLFLKPCS
jgi:1,4-alpha-glucan branching enzyme